MSFLHRLLRTAPDPREAWRPLWHRLVIAAREEHWYADAGVADTLDGRFDMVSMLTALAILRLEGEADTYCVNVDCPNRILETLDHFASRKAMDIEGLGYETAKALLDQNPNPTNAEIREGMARALCRCMTYYRVQAAIKRVARGAPARGTSTVKEVVK